MLWRDENSIGLLQGRRRSTALQIRASICAEPYARSGSSFILRRERCHLICIYRRGTLLSVLLSWRWARSIVALRLRVAEACRNVSRRVCGKHRKIGSQARSRPDAKLVCIPIVRTVHYVTTAQQLLYLLFFFVPLPLAAPFSAPLLEAGSSQHSQKACPQT